MSSIPPSSSSNQLPTNQNSISAKTLPGMVQTAREYTQRAISGVGALFKPVDFLGQRYTLPFSSQPFPKNPYAQLLEMNRSIARFERIENESSVLQTPPSPQPVKVTSNTIPFSIHSPINPAALTDAELHKLNAHAAQFGIIYALHWVIGQDTDEQMDSIFEMTRRSVGRPGESQPNLKQLIFQKFTHLSLFQKTKIHILYFICTFRGFFQKTVESCSERILQELRLRFASALHPTDGTTGELLPRIIEDGIRFLKAYRSAIQNHAKGISLTDTNGQPIPSPSLADHKNMAIKKLFGKTLKDLCKEVSKTLLDHLFPKVEYKPGARILNWVMNKAARWYLKRNLPDLIEKGLNKSTEQTKPHKLPFVKAIVETLSSQLDDLQESLNDGTLNPPPETFPGTQNLPAFIEEFLAVLEYGENPTEQQVLNIMSPNHSPAIDQELMKNFQEATVKPLNILLHYLVKPQNTEKLFRNLFQLLNLPFDVAQKVTQGEVDELNEELLEKAENVFLKAVEESVTEKLQGGMSHQKIDSYAKEQFKKRKDHISSCADRLEGLHRHLCEAIGRISSTELEAIYQDLCTLKNTLKAFSLEEKSSQKGFAFLPQSAQEAILRPLLPVYAQANDLMNSILLMQKSILDFHAINEEQQKQLAQHFDSIHKESLEASEIITGLIALPANTPIQDQMAVITRVEGLILRIEATLKQIRLLQHTLRDHLSETEYQDQTNYLEVLQHITQNQRIITLTHHLDASLRLFLRRDPNQNIQILLNQLNPEDQAKLAPLIAHLKPPSNTTQIESQKQTVLAIGIEIQKIRAQAIERLNAVNQTINPIHQAVSRHIELHSENKRAQEQIGLQNLVQSSERLTNTLTRFRILITQAKREEQYHPSAEQLDRALTAVAGGMGAAAGYYYPGIGTVVSGILAGFVRRATQTAETWASGRASQLPPLLTSVATDAAGLYTISSQFGPYASIAATAAASAWTAGNARGNGINAGVDLVMRRLKALFKNAKEFVTNDFLYKGAAKMALHEVIQSYSTIPVINL